MTYAAHGHAQLLAKLGAEVWLVVGSKGKPKQSRSVSGDYDIKTFDISGSGQPWSRIHGDLTAVLEFSKKIAPDLVIAEGWYTWGTSILPQLRRYSRHCVISSHGAADKTIGIISPSRIFRSLVYRYFEKFRSSKILDALSAAIVLSPRADNDRFADQRQFSRRGIPVFVSPNFSNYKSAVSPRQLHPVRRLLHIGEMCENKNQRLAIQTLANLPQNYCLELAFPTKNEYFKNLNLEARRLGVSDRIEYTVSLNRQQLEASFERASLLLILSHTEAQPIVAIDAVCTGLPFVSTPVGCMTELEGGLIAKPVDIAASVLSIHASTEIYQSFSQAAITHYHEACSARISEHSLERLLLSLRA